ncbi:MAG: M16 family metallopeptidase [Candidatus Dormibacteria bacterium]
MTTPGAMMGAITLVVRRGSRDEKRTETGLTQFVAELFFGATTHRPDREAVLEEIDALGASVKVKVSPESTVFQISGRASDLQKLAELLGDMVNNPAPSVEDVDSTRQEILNAIDTLQMDPESWVEHHVLSTAFAPGSSLAKAELPDRKVVEHVRREELLAFRKQLLRGDQCALIVTGGMTLDEKTARACTASLVPGRPAVRLRNAPSWQAASRPPVKYVRQPIPGDRPKLDVSLVLPGIARDDPDWLADSVLQQILSGGMLARLFAVVRGKLGLCYGITAESQRYENCGAFVISTSALPENGSPALAAAVAQLVDLAENGPKDKEIADAKKQFAFAMGYQEESAKMRGLATAIRWGAGKPFESREARLAAINAISKKDVQRIAKRIVSRIPEARLVYSATHDVGKDLAASLQKSASHQHDDRGVL